MTTRLYGYPTLYSPAITANPQHPRQSPDPVDALLSQFKAAQDAHASHLSADGLTAYDRRFGYLYHCTWDAERHAFSSWLRGKWGEGVPAGAVKVE